MTVPSEPVTDRQRTARLNRRGTARDLLRGDLHDSNLPEVLQFLRGLHRDGQLLLEHLQPHLSAGIYLSRGELVHAVCPPYQGMDALAHLLGWRIGRYAFVASATTTLRTIHGPFQAVLLEALRCHDELQASLRRLPAAEVVLHLERDPQVLTGIRLDVRQWRILRLVDGRRSCRRVVELAGGTAEVAEILYGLYAWGVVRGEANDAWLQELIPVRLGAESRQGINPAALSPTACHFLRACDGFATVAAMAVEAGVRGEMVVSALCELVEDRWIAFAAGQSVYNAYIGVPETTE